MESRAAWLVLLTGIVVTGILSRVTRTGSILFDKYLGDALYAAMVYAVLRLISRQSPARSAIAAMIIMALLELFQLTMIPAHWLESSHLSVRLVARLMGTQFSTLDLIAYAVGIASIHFASQAVGGLRH